MYGSSRILDGDLYVLGLNAKLHMKQIKAQIGVVPQENGLDPDFSALDNLLVYASYFSIPKEKSRARAMELLTLMQLEDHAHKQIDELSGGMKRRLVLARALLTKPKLIFLDEPTTGLDPQARNWLWDELRSIQKSGGTLFLTTHYMEEAEYLCDRISIMNNGQTVTEGKPKDLIETYIGREVIEIEMLAPELDAYVNKIKGKHTFQIMRNKIKIFIRQDENKTDLLRDISGSNIVIRKSSLNDVFLKISGNELND
jgi:lipooligosaccharide transport system ATP-binding protein